MFNHLLKGACAAATLTICIAPNDAVATAYLDAANWLAALPNAPVLIEPFPSYVALRTDAFGTWSAPSSNGGAFSGSFSCHSLVNPCSGAYQITYTLPFEIIGYEGTLHYNNGWYYDSTRVFPVPIDELRLYNGFYGEIFGPTNTITLFWPPGLRSLDSFAAFDFGMPKVVRAVPEPASSIILISGLLGLSLSLRSRAKKISG